MEYTNDMVFSVSYGEVNSLPNDKKRTSKFLQIIKKHKIMVTALFSLIVFISIDVVLITNFFKILTMI